MVELYSIVNEKERNTKQENEREREREREREKEDNFIAMRRCVVLYLLSRGSAVTRETSFLPLKARGFILERCASGVAPIPAFGRNRW